MDCVNVMYPTSDYYDEGYPAERYPRGGYPDDRYPRGGYPDRGGYADPGYPDGQYPGGGYQGDGYWDDEYPGHGYPGGGYGYPDDEYADEGYYGDGYPEEESPGPPRRRRGLPRTARIAILAASIALWAFGLAATNTSSLGLYGLPASLSPLFYAGLALLIVSAGLELAARELSPFRLGLHAGALALMLYGTAGFAYPEGRYSWLYKTIGVVQYMDANGHVTPGIDIYQSWPGFFALAGWFDHVAGVGTPMDYAKWAQLVFELAALPLLYSIYDSLALPVRHRWLALFLYLGGNWIAQDYFSPQALSTVLSLGIMALALRWMRAGNVLAHLGRDTETPEGRDRLRPREGPTRLDWKGAVPFLVAVLLLTFVLVSTHELSPYIIAVEFMALAFVGQVRPRWLPVAVVAITIAYLIPNFSYVNSHYGLTSSIGSFFSNASGTSGLAGGTPPPSQRFIGDCADALSGFMWLLALAGAWVRRKSWRTVIALLFLTFSPVLVLFGGSYGGEGIMRVYLFSLPWAAALAAAALLPLRRLHHGFPDASDAPPPGAGGVLSRFDRGSIRAPAALAVAVALFLPAFYGNDAANTMSRTQVNATTAFLDRATPGMILCPEDNSSVSSTARYNQFPIGTIFGDYGIISTDPSKMNVADYLARTVVNYTNGVSPGYVLITPSMLADNAAYNYVPTSYYTELENQLRTSKYWKAIVDTDGTLVYEITPAASSMPAGPYNNNPVLTVP